jgi:hypothetical protein
LIPAGRVVANPGGNGTDDPAAIYTLDGGYRDAGAAPT